MKGLLQTVFSHLRNTVSNILMYDNRVLHLLISGSSAVFMCIQAHVWRLSKLGTEQVVPTRFHCVSTENWSLCAHSGQGEQAEQVKRSVCFIDAHTLALTLWRSHFGGASETELVGAVIML